MFNVTLVANDTEPQARLVLRMGQPAGSAIVRALPRRLLGRRRNDEGGLPLEDDNRRQVVPPHAVEHLEVLVDERRRVPRIPAPLRGAEIDFDGTDTLPPKSLTIYRF